MRAAALVLALVAGGARAEAAPPATAPAAPRPGCDLKLPADAGIEEVRARTREAVKSGRCSLADLNAIAARAAQSLDDDCKRGDREKCADLAGLLLRGRSRKRDTKRALQMFEGLCAKNHARSCHELGIVAMRGWDAPQDFARADRFLRRACRAKLADACDEHKRLPRTADERRQFSQARDAMKASERECGENSKQCMVIARKMVRGDGMEKSEEVAWRLYLVACEAGETGACALLGR